MRHSRWIEFCHSPSGGKDRAEVVVNRGAEVELLSFFEQSEFVQRIPQRCEDWFPVVPLTEDVVARIVRGGALGEVIGSVAFAFPVGEIGAC
jgi:hypothetical protein